MFFPERAPLGGGCLKALERFPGSWDFWGAPEQAQPSGDAGMPGVAGPGGGQQGGMGHGACRTICQVSRPPFPPGTLSLLILSFSLWGGTKQPGYLPRDESLSLWKSWLLLRDQSLIQQGKHLPGPEYLYLPFSPTSSELPALRMV